MASNRVRCNYCGVLLKIPPNHQCPICQNIIPVQPNDSLTNTNINMMVTKAYSNYGSGFGYYPQPSRPPVSVFPLTVHGRKRAVLCGVSYYGQRGSLQGTINDVKCMKYFLNQGLGFPNDSILVLSEEESNPSFVPTRNNILNALQWLVQGCQSGDSLVFHFSGHGSQTLDFNRDEIDGYDEVLWPVDHRSNGTILDDEINAIIVRPLPQGAKLHAIIDTCHSGTILDLPFVCRMNRDGSYLWKDHGRQSGIYKGTNGGLAVSISSCEDHQVSIGSFWKYSNRCHDI